MTLDELELRQRLGAVAITDPAIGDARLRRVLEGAGFSTVLDLLDCSDADIDGLVRSRKLSMADADEVDAIRRRYAKNPAKYLASLEGGGAAVSSSLPAADSIIAKVQSSPHKAETTRSSSHTPVVPANLAGYEERARRSFDQLASRGSAFFVFEAFEDFPTELDEISQGFAGLFARWRFEPREALAIVESSLPDLFLVYVAHQAQRLFDRKNFWERLFSELGVSDWGIQTQFKRLFLSLLQARHMPTYDRDEQDHYYLYTAVLHGGLSRALWDALWEKSLLPLCKDQERNAFEARGVYDGHMVLQRVRERGKYEAPKSVMGVLGKAPDDLLVPLFDSAFNVARQTTSLGMGTDDSALLWSYGLPDSAMKALADVVGRRPAAGSSSGRSRNHVGTSKRSFVYLPLGRLCLDLGTGILSVFWKRQRLPRELAGHRIDYYLNGNLARQEEVGVGVDAAILEAVDIPVAPSPRYDLEVRLMAPFQEGDDVTYREMSSFGQSLEGRHRGSLDFVRTPSGSYELVTRREHFTGTRRVAYVVGPGLRLIPGHGMRPVEVRELADAAAARVEVYDISPGASGSLVGDKDGEVLSAWQEGYSARIEKLHQIGTTDDGLDVFGVSDGPRDYNKFLPVVTIEAADGERALDDLDVSLVCDGRRVSVGRRLVWGDAEDTAARVMLLLDEVIGLSTLFRRCILRCTTRSSGTVVLSYRFAIAPVKEFGVTSLSLRRERPTASYTFQATENVSICYLGVEDEVLWGQHFSITEDLDKASTEVCFGSLATGIRMTANLWLLGVSCKLPRRLREADSQRPLCVADMLGAGRQKGTVTITAHERRPGRRLLAMLGYCPLAYHDLEHPGTHVIDLFSRPDVFSAEGGSSETFEAFVATSYGESTSSGVHAPIWADAPLASCRRGLGFSSYILVTTDQGTLVRLDGPVCCNVRAGPVRPRR